MKYAIWRHEFSIGNSAEHTIGLYKHLLRIGDKEPTVYVESEFQKYFALCIPLLKEENIKFFPNTCNLVELYSDSFTSDIYFPNAYRENMSYPATWEYLGKEPDVTLQFPDYLYKNNKNLPKETILLQIREAGTFNKRRVGAFEEEERFVKIETFFTIAKYFASLGYTVVRLGDKNQTPMPKHKNIYDFALEEKEKTISDDLFLINNCKLFISCDSGIWPMAGGMKKNLVLCNITSPLDTSYAEYNNGELQYLMRKSCIVDWLPEETTTLLFKTPGKNGLPKDNSLKEILTAAEKFLK
jgi:hypothetical protein